ncbi:MAG TPA: hypothetical protein VFJ47_09995 [Terriglobales bacterium]|nr:hypothetical protein [Terriglobales bacterium]
MMNVTTHELAIQIDASEGPPEVLTIGDIWWSYLDGVRDGIERTQSLRSPPKQFAHRGNPGDMIQPTD